MKSFECSDDDFLYFEEGFISLFFSVFGEHIQFELFDVPLAADGLVVSFSVFLNGDVSEMHFCVLYFGLVIATVCETCESSSIEVDSQGRVVGHESVETNIKLLSSD